MTRRCPATFSTLPAPGIVTRALAAAAVVFATASSAFAQASGPVAPAVLPSQNLPELPGVPAATASAPAGSAGRTGPRAQRLRSPEETGDRATAPGDLRPERPVEPQISIPIGKKPPPASPPSRAARTGNPAASGPIDDAAARCESQLDDKLRASCRASLAR